MINRSYPARHGEFMMAAQHDAIPETALEWHRSGGAAIATVIETWGSAPRPAGSQLAVAADGRMAGSVSGGCVEGAVVAEVDDAITSGRSRILEFGVSDDEAFSVGLACGGRIRVLLEPIGGENGIPEDILAALTDLRAQRIPALYRVNICTWERQIDVSGGVGLDLVAQQRMVSDRVGLDGDWFVAVHNPPLRMIVVGAVHIAQSLMKMAWLTGYEPTLVDPRSAFASSARFPGETIMTEWPDEAIPALKPDTRTAVVTLTHDPKIDDAAIQATLPTSAFYIGCLGSVRTHDKRCRRLIDAGVDDDQLARLNAPVGLDISARTPAEIAVAIMAEVTETLRKFRDQE